jgi:hypothetical protein
METRIVKATQNENIACTNKRLRNKNKTKIDPAMPS